MSKSHEKISLKFLTEEFANKKIFQDCENNL